MALTATIGGATSDTYATLAEWETYAADFLNQDITAHGHDTSHEANLRRAAAYIDRTYAFKGNRVTDTQSMQWPRFMDETVDGWNVSSLTIPLQIKQAQQELAWLIHEGTDVFATVENGALIKSKVKGAVLESEKEYSGAHEQAVYAAVEVMLAPYIDGKRTTGGLKSVPLVRG